MTPSRESAREALRTWARSDPEQPFLFFRSPRGTFTWWSFARADEALSTAKAAGDEPAAPRELLGVLADAVPSELEAARELAASSARAGEREIWISARGFDRPEERLLALAAVLAGWAVLREPPDAIESTVTPDLFLWARPTLLSGSEAELLALFDGVGAAAPRWRRARWLARRLERLATLIVERDGSQEVVRRHFAALGARPASAPRVLSFPGTGW